MTAIDRGAAHEIAMQIAIQRELSDEQRWRLEAALVEPTPPATDERAEFEKAYRAYCGWGNFDKDKQPNGRYLAGERLENSWAMWQAARADRAELLMLAEKLEAARKTWHEDFGVPVSQTYANFLEAIGALIDGIRARKAGKDKDKV